MDCDICRACSIQVWVVSRFLGLDGCGACQQLMIRAYEIPFPYHPCMVYLPTWMVDFDGKLVGNTPYMDALGIGFP